MQAFRYRGAAQRSTAGEVFVLHPDETHDGHAGTDAGFRYRILYVAPRLVQDALGAARALPFVRDAVSRNARLMRAIMPALADLDAPLEDLQRDEIIADLAQALADADPSRSRRGNGTPRAGAPSIWRARFSTRPRAVTSAELEAVTGLSRYALARHFRACLGTSPHRYLVMRRLDRARGLIREGVPLADARLPAASPTKPHDAAVQEGLRRFAGAFAALAA